MVVVVGGEEGRLVLFDLISESWRDGEDEKRKEGGRR